MVVAAILHFCYVKIGPHKNWKYMAFWQNYLIVISIISFRVFYCVVWNLFDMLRSTVGMIGGKMMNEKRFWLIIFQWNFIWRYRNRQKVIYHNLILPVDSLLWRLLIVRFLCMTHVLGSGTFASDFVEKKIPFCRRRHRQHNAQTWSERESARVFLSLPNGTKMVGSSNWDLMIFTIYESDGWNVGEWRNRILCQCVIVLWATILSACARAHATCRLWNTIR